MLSKEKNTMNLNLRDILSQALLNKRSLKEEIIST